MEDGRIANYQITASSAWKNGTKAYFGRLDADPRDPIRGISNGVWTPTTSNKHQWIQVNFGIPRLVTGIITQGRNGDDQWVTRYKVQYGDDGISWEYAVDSKQNKTVISYPFNCNMFIKLKEISPTYIIVPY